MISLLVGNSSSESESIFIRLFLFLWIDEFEPVEDKELLDLDLDLDFDLNLTGDGDEDFDLLIESTSLSDCAGDTERDLDEAFEECDEARELDLDDCSTGWDTSNLFMLSSSKKNNYHNQNYN